MSANALLSPPKARPGDRVAVLSPSFAAPAVAPQVHEHAMRRLQEITGLIPVEYPTTRKLGACPRERARDLMAAFADDSIRAICATIGGDDQITVIPHLDPEAVRAHPKPFLGYSDNTHLHHFLTTCGLRSFYGGSTQVHLGPGPHVDREHAAGLRAALLTGEKLKITRPAQSEDHGLDWGDPAVLTSFGQREDTEEWTWAGPRAGVTGRTWGGCLEVVSDLLAAGRFAMAPTDLEGAVLLIELSEEITPTRAVFRMLRALGERGVLAAAAAVLFARSPVSSFQTRPDDETRRAMRVERDEMVIETIADYNPQAVVCCGVPFGHTCPQWILPYGGRVAVDGAARTVEADYS